MPPTPAPTSGPTDGPLQPPATWHHRDFDAATLAAAKADRRISVVLPARDEEATVGAIVTKLRHALIDDVDLIDEILVVDSGCTDRTAEVATAAGADVIDAVELFPELGASRGKGDALWRSIAAAKGDIVVWLDSDIVDFDVRMATGVLGPLLHDDSLVLSKGFYERPIAGPDGTLARTGGGRVTELVARPTFALLFPELAGFVQPLSGEYAVRREAVLDVAFPCGYGVEVGLLVDLWRRHGLGAIAQVDLEERIHRNRPLDQLGRTAFEVLHTLLARSGLHPELRDTFVRANAFGDLDAVTVEVGQRPPMRDYLVDNPRA